MSQIFDLQITCPRCGTEFETTGHTIVDAADEADAEVLWQLQNGSLNMAECPNCKATGLLPVPVIYHDPKNELLLGFVPNSDGLDDDNLSDTIGPVLQGFIANVPEDKQQDYLFHPIVTDDQEALIAAARGELTREDLMEAGTEEDDDEAAELTPEEQAQMNQRVELLQKLFEANDSIERITMLRQHREIVDDILHQMLAVIVMQAEESQPELLPTLQKFMNEIEVFRASNPTSPLL